MKLQWEPKVMLNSANTQEMRVQTCGSIILSTQCLQWIRSRFHPHPLDKTPLKGGWRSSKESLIAMWTLYLNCKEEITLLNSQSYWGTLKKISTIPGMTIARLVKVRGANNQKLILNPFKRRPSVLTRYSKERCALQRQILGPSWSIWSIGGDSSTVSEIYAPP